MNHWYVTQSQIYSLEKTFKIDKKMSYQFVIFQNKEITGFITFCTNLFHRTFVK